MKRTIFSLLIIINLVIIFFNCTIPQNTNTGEGGVEKETSPGIVTAPQFSPSEGTYSDDQNVIITTPTTGATIYYTIDGTNPDSSSIEYIAPILVAGHGTIITIKAIAIKTGMANSGISLAIYHINYNKCSTPQFTPSGGTYASDQNVIITTSTTGATIRYTTDGSTPSSTHGEIYNSAINIDSPITLKAIAYKSGMLDSSITSETYNITGIVAIPVMNPSGGVYFSDQTVTISTDTSGATIRYTIDGSEPSTTHGTVYTDPILVSSFTTIKAIAYKTGCSDSPIETESYIICSNSTIDSAGDVGQYTSIAIDSNNKVHISYVDEPNELLKYITNASGSWQAINLDAIGAIGNENATTSIAIDSDDKVHISYTADTGSNQILKYATNLSGSWVCTTIDDSFNVGKYSSIAIDSNDNVHISYEDLYYEDLKYITNSSGSWISTTIDSADRVGGPTSIVIDSNDKVHIVYDDYTNDDIKYATNVTGAWICSIADSDGGSWISLEIDSNDKLHISCYYNSTLKYITNSGGSWNSFVFTSTNIGMFSCIAIDSNDNVHISHFTNNGSDLMYTTNRNGSWENFRIDTNNTGLYTSIAVDSNDMIHISSYDYTFDDLKYSLIK